MRRSVDDTGADIWTFFYVDDLYEFKMVDDLIDQAILKAVERAGVLCKDDETLHTIYDGVLEPVMTHVTTKFSWMVYVLEMLASLIIVQTVLLCVALYYIRK